MSMCDQCSEVLVLLNNHHSRHVSGGSVQLSRSEVETFIRYSCSWNNKQCLCVYKDLKNFDRLTNLVQVVLNMAIELIQCLPQVLAQKLSSKAQEVRQRSISQSSAEEEGQRRQSQTLGEEDECPDEADDDLAIQSMWEEWTIEELKRLLDFQTSLFLSNFAVYRAHKVMTAHNMEELSSAETTALHNYCEINDMDAPLLLLRNVCFFIDSNGVGALSQCFEKANNKNLPLTFAHTLITIITNLRMWVNTPTILTCVVPLRSPIIRYMCTLSEADMRAAAAHNTMELMWQAIKEPMDSQMTFDREVMALVYKCFTSTTLTIRLGSICQISTLINTYNDNISNELMSDIESFGDEMAKWLLDNKIVEQIFGPNLHIEIIKQSQIILNFLGAEGKINNQHLDCIWAAAQLKHCGKQVYEVLLPLIKSVEPEQNRHLRHLIDKLDPASYNESVLYLSSILTRSQWQAFQVEEAQRRKLTPAGAAPGSRRSTRAPAPQVSSSDSDSDDGGAPPPAKLPQRNPELAVAVVTEQLAGALGSEDDHCCSGCIPQHTVHHLPQQSQHHHHHHHHHALHHRQQQHLSLHHAGVASDSSIEGQSDLSYEEEEEEEENPRLRAVVHSVMAKTGHASCGGESSEDEGGVDVVVTKEGIPLPRSVRGRVVGLQPDVFPRNNSKAEVSPGQVAALVVGAAGMPPDPTPMEEAGSDDEEEEEEEEEEDDDEEMSSENETSVGGGHRGAAGLEAEKALRSQRLATQLMAADQALVRVHEEEEEDEDNDEEEDEEADDRKVSAKEAAQVKIADKRGCCVGEEEWAVIQGGQLQAARRSEQQRQQLMMAEEEDEEGLASVENKDLKPVTYDLTILLSPEREEGSCHSSGLSTKSEKNMADFDGEEGVSEEELVQINAHIGFNPHQPAGHMSALYHPRGAGVRRASQKSKSPASDFRLEEVCKPGHTLLWDLVQDNMANLLPEGMAAEAEKALTTLLCCSNDRQIRTKFIEAIIDNLAKNKSVVVSLRLLTKLFSSFNSMRPIGGSYKVVLWAEKSLHMMTHFFNNLVHFTEQSQDRSTWTSHHGFKEEVSARLVFLSCVFSSQYSPDSFRLSQGQADQLWECLATDPESCQDCLSWFYDQARGKENHALHLDTFRHIFVNKMPKLQAETMPMIGLNLFQQLSNITCVVNCQSATLTEEQACGMDQLWEIALKATTKAVSTEAIHILNNYYINYAGGTLDKEGEFVQRCMDSLMQALQTMRQDPVGRLAVIQRGLLLCKHHLDAFRQRYAYHLRRWQLAGAGISSHQPMSKPQSITIYLKTADLSESQIEMQQSSLVSELRAEVSHWWEELQKAQPKPAPQSSSPGIMSPLLGSMLGEGPLRMMCLGQELTVDVDERTLADLHMTDGQHVSVSIGANRQQRKNDGSVPSSCLPVPDRRKLPMNLMIQEPHFDNLFTLLGQLSDVSSLLDNVDKEKRASVQAEARRLSRDVWELLMVLPTNENLLKGFMKISSDQVTPEELCQLLPPASPHRLYYSLQIVEFLAQGTKLGQRLPVRQGAGDPSDEKKTGSGGKTAWCAKFIAKGGLSHLMDIFMNGSLQSKEGNVWSQWNQECLGYLLRLISQFSVDGPAQSETEASGSRLRRPVNKKSSSLVIYTISQSVLDSLDVQAVVKILMQILYDAAMPMDSNQLYCGTWGRGEVVQHAMSFLVSLAFSCPQVLEYLCSADNFHSWLKRLTLEAPEAHVRKQACLGLHRLCLGRTRQDKKVTTFLGPVLEQLLTFLSDSELFKPKKYEMDYTREEKEIYGAGCHDYFIFIRMCLDELDAQQTNINMDTLLKQVTDDVLNRPFYETHKGFEEDEGLLGLLNVATAIYRHKPPFFLQEENTRFLDALFDFLFLVPSPRSPHLPKCKSQKTRQAAYDLIAEMCSGNMKHYSLAVDKFMKQNTREAHAPYPWEYWPQEDGRAKCGYVGLTNLGATCYMATAVQQLFMIPRLRQSVLHFQVNDNRPHAAMMMELQRMFAYLQESERRAYNPKSFCKTYMMDRCPLNTGEQKDMQEFFTDIITKLEETSGQMKMVIKEMFGGETTNNVVSLDCNHVSRTFEEFYTVRCGVAHMKDLYESLDEVTVKDMLEGDNMYTCSHCHKKVRAEKRTCFRKLPRILCFNTLRYSFNMLTMMKEKVNTHFSFPDALDMSRYMEHNLIGKDKIKDAEGEAAASPEEQSYEYRLIGVTVHVGSAEGGHYYNLIKDTQSNKWYHFNDADVKPFDPSNIPHEAFGGEMNFPLLQGKHYDTVSDKYLDFPIEKTNSAYMLFYERVSPNMIQDTQEFNFELSPDLAAWIWNDNTQFLKDRSIFDRMYFDHMWQMCSHLPSTLTVDVSDRANHKAVVLASCFLLESFIHAKEKNSMPKWIDYLMKKFNSCLGPCEWLLEHMAGQDWWLQHILIKCPNSVIRQMFQRLLIMMITQLSKASTQYILLSPGLDTAETCGHSCLTRFITKLLSNLECGMRPTNKFISDYFTFLFEFAKLQDSTANFPTAAFLNSINTISMLVRFYMGGQADYVEILSDEDEEEVLSMSPDEVRPVALSKLISLVAYLVETSRDGHVLQLSDSDMNYLIRGRGHPFLMYQVRDNINIEHTCNLIVSLCMFNEPLAVSIVTTIFNNIKKLGDLAKPFFDLLTLLTEFSGRLPGQPSFTQLIVSRLWELTKVSPRQCLEWLTNKVSHNRLARLWTLDCMEGWLELYMVAYNSNLVRMASAQLLVSLVPNEMFRSNYRPRLFAPCPSSIVWSKEDLAVMHRIYQHLLLLLKRAHVYIAPYDGNQSNMVGPSHAKLMSLFSVLTYCLYSRREKLMFTPFFLDLWQLFHPFMLEPQIPLNHNKQALLLFWFNVCQDCPENLQQMVSNQHVCKNIAFNYILADHEDEQNIHFNRGLLPAYYGLLRMACEYSTAFMRQLAGHQNLQWAFKNVLPYPHQYLEATEELMCMMKMMADRKPEHCAEEAAAVENFRKTILTVCTTGLDPRVMWQTLCSIYKVLVETPEDHLSLLYQNGLSVLSQSFFIIYTMFHEATACHMTGDLIDVLQLIHALLMAANHAERKAELRSVINQWKERNELAKKLLTLLNSFVPVNLRASALDVLHKMVLVIQKDITQFLTSTLLHAHSAFQNSNPPMSVGPFYPTRSYQGSAIKANVRPSRPQFQMYLHAGQLEVTKGTDEEYDKALVNYYEPYHRLIDRMSRMAINLKMLNSDLINLYAMVAYEGVPLHLPYFAKLWNEIMDTSQTADPDHNLVNTLCKCNSFIDYIDTVLIDERRSLNNDIIYQFFRNFFPRVHEHVITDGGQSLVMNLVASIQAEADALRTNMADRDVMPVLNRLLGELRALQLILSVRPRQQPSPLLPKALRSILRSGRLIQQHRADMMAAAQARADAEAARREREERRRKEEEERQRQDMVDKEMEEDKRVDDGEDEEPVVRRRRKSSNVEGGESLGATPCKRARSRNEETEDCESPTSEPADRNVDIMTPVAEANSSLEDPFVPEDENKPAALQVDEDPLVEQPNSKIKCEVEKAAASDQEAQSSDCGGALKDKSEDASTSQTENVTEAVSPQKEATSVPPASADEHQEVEASLSSSLAPSPSDRSSGKADDGQAERRDSMECLPSTSTNVHSISEPGPSTSKGPASAAAAFVLSESKRLGGDRTALDSGHIPNVMVSRPTSMSLGGAGFSGANGAQRGMASSGEPVCGGPSVRSQGPDLCEKVVKSAEAVLALLSHLHPDTG
ncbi:ubiquitin carboxyl-terminal hydrolase 34 [Aplysia californica]|uniref:ubiquitinyl hydrolase 1 n=1 Tax=Aplysia californica TaxID=6500 RepID=A0ABM1A5N6_APLCA|nr:ubiquitin carboxyl-terminal hydrolase 34 [Aplysia californica]